MLTRERLIAFLRKEKKFCSGDQFTDENGIACFLGCTTRTLRNWRDEGKGPPAGYTTRVVYDLDEAVAWYQETIIQGSKKLMEKD
jgi:hypothetical protein